jgi:diguanylate cyclase
MYLNGAKQVDSQAEAAMASMQVHGVPQTPSNFSVWYAYHSGQNPDLTRTIEVLVSNNCPIDDQTLDQLYEKYFRSPVADMVLCDTSIRARETLKTVLDLVERVRSDASGIGAAINDISTQLHTNVSGLAELIDSLVEETGKIAGRSERLGLDLKQSVDKIGALGTDPAGRSARGHDGRPDGYREPQIFRYVAANDERRRHEQWR